MRFQFKYPLLLLLIGFAHPSRAGEALPVLPTDRNSMTLAQTSHPEPGQDDPVVIEADSMVGKTKDQIEATGDATLRQGEKSIRADSLIFNQRSHDIDARGAVMLEQNGNAMHGPHLLFNMDKNSGTMDQPQFYLKDNNSRGTAQELHIVDKQHYSMDHATYTTCPAGNQDWQLRMSRLELDRDRQVGVAHNASIEFGGVPILYSPWMDFPLNNQGKSGFLAPTIGSTVNSGIAVSIPYYWRIAPNFDATITPTEMSKRGLMLNNEFRYLESSYNGAFNVDALPNDAIANRSRELFSLVHNQTMTNNLTGYVNFTRVGDNAYFRDLGNAVNVTSQVNLLQEGGLNYDAGWWTAQARVQHYQTLQDPAAPIALPYTRVPQLTLNAVQSYAGANFILAGEYVNFSQPYALSGTRVVLNPSISYALVNNPAFYLTPRVALHSAYYDMGANNTGSLQNASSTLPMLSIDSGVTFEREVNQFNNDYVQTLEPRAFYVFVPYKDQTQLPNFDSALADVNFTQIFTENRFVGNDRVGDANYLTLAMTSRLLEQANGMERLKVMIGERFSFSAPQVNLVTPATTTNTSTTSSPVTPATSISKQDILLALSGRMTRHWSLDSEFDFDPNQSQTHSYNITTSYRPEVGKVLNLGYLFQRNFLHQVDFSTQWPLFNRWHAVGRLNYSLQDSRILEAIGGLEYNQDCWMMRLVVQRFATAAQQFNTGFFVQFELKDFVNINAIGDPLALLKQNVSGYTDLNDKTAIQAPQVLH